MEIKEGFFFQDELQNLAVPEDHYKGLWIWLPELRSKRLVEGFTVSLGPCERVCHVEI